MGRGTRECAASAGLASHILGTVPRLGVRHAEKDLTWSGAWFQSPFFFPVRIIENGSNHADARHATETDDDTDARFSRTKQRS